MVPACSLPSSPILHHALVLSLVDAAEPGLGRELLLLRDMTVGLIVAVAHSNNEAMVKFYCKSFFVSEFQCTISVFFHSFRHAVTTQLFLLQILNVCIYLNSLRFKYSGYAQFLAKIL